MKKLILLGSVSACLLASGVASATHRNWLLKDGSAECQFATPQAGDALGVMGELYNFTSSSRTAICPVAIANRWGSSGTVAFYPPYWTNAMFADVDFLREAAGVKTVSCYAAMQAHDGSKYYSTTISNTGNIGAGRIILASPGAGTAEGVWVNDATHTLEANDDLAPSSLDYTCVVPDHTALLGHRVRLCQYFPNCNPGPGVDPDQPPSSDPPLLGSSGSTLNFVQVSGIECTAANSPTSTANITRSENGITNSSSTPQDVFCPITPPADNTTDHYRYVSYPKVQYSGGSQASSCVTDGTCPSCQLKWFGRDGTEHDMGGFTKDSVASQVVLATLNIGIGGEVQFGLQCRLPQNVTLEGATVLVSMGQTDDGGT